MRLKRSEKGIDAGAGDKVFGFTELTGRETLTIPTIAETKNILLRLKD